MDGNHRAKWEMKRGFEQVKWEKKTKRQADDDAVARFEGTYVPNVSELLQDVKKTKLGLGSYREVFRRYCGLYLSGNVRERISSVKDVRDVEVLNEYTAAIERHRQRLTHFKEDLIQMSQKFRAIQNCLLIKEELMQKAWHPRRVERILEVGGWELLDNLLGCQ